MDKGDQVYCAKMLKFTFRVRVRVESGLGIGMGLKLVLSYFRLSLGLDSVRRVDN